MKVRKVYLKETNGVYRVTKTVDAGTEFSIGQVLEPKQVDRLTVDRKYTITIT